MTLPVTGLVTSGVIPQTTITIRTFGPSTIDRQGRAVDGSSTDHNETMPVHTLSSKRMIDRLSAVDREREPIALYPLADSALMRASGSRPVRLQYLGRWFEVRGTADYAGQGGVLIVLAARFDAKAAA